MIIANAKLKSFEETFEEVTFGELESENYWAKKGLIPLGVLKPHYMYDDKDNIPMNEIAKIKFDKINVPFTTRKALNILLLGGSGDHKSLVMKNIWSVLHDAGWYCLYFDAKSTDSGRARRSWNNRRTAPFIKPKGIKLKHYMPFFATKDFDHLVHNFKVYSLRIQDIDEKEMWLGLGMTGIGSSKMRKVINRHPKGIEENKLYKELRKLERDDDMVKGSLNAIYSRLNDLYDANIFSKDYPEINLKKDWEAGYSVAISYNSKDRIFMSFDVGEKIKRSRRLYFSRERDRPVMFFPDDASFYAKKLPDLKYNFAVEEIKNVGFNDRSLGQNNCLAVQSLGIIDEDVAQSYRIKIITPKFSDIEGLYKIKIPQQAIDIIKSGRLLRMIDKERHIIPMLLIDEEDKVQIFFPFFPPCEHFKEVYFPKKGG